jgi:hypothetical protein
MMAALREQKVADRYRRRLGFVPEPGKRWFWDGVMLATDDLDG